MLALERPLGVVAELALFGDHVDPKRVFYIPTRPRLARDVSGTPELSYVRFQHSNAEEGGVGLLSFTTELTTTEQQLEQAKDHVVRLGIPEPMLVQVPWTGGKAVLAAALEEGDGFVEKLIGQVTPDLAATNRATFAARMNQEGARLVEGLIAMSGPSPLGVRYELEYAGLRPALDVHVRADYKRIYSELSWGFQFGVAYEGVGVRASVESAIQKLIQAGAIQIEVLHFTDDAGLQERVERAIRWLQEQILEDFFKTSLQPAKHENLLEKAMDAAKRLGAATLGDALRDATKAGQLAQELGIPMDLLKTLGGAAGKAGGGGAAAGGIGGGGAGGAGASDSTFALKLQFTFRDIKQEELKTITLDWREARAERRTAAPQGLLSRFNVPPNVSEAASPDAFWETLHVNVRPLGDFDALGVQRLVVQLAFPDEVAPTTQLPLSFVPGENVVKRFAAFTNGKPPRYRGRIEVQFKDDGPWPGPPTFIGPWRTMDSLELAMHPLSEVPRFEVEIAPGTLSFADTPQAQVDLRVDGNQVATVMITEAKPSVTFRRRAERAAEPPDPSAENEVARPLLEARPTWFLAGGGRVEGVWAPVEGASVLVHAPWRSTRTIRLLPVLPADFMDAVVTLTMANGPRTSTVRVPIPRGDASARVVEIPSIAEQPPPVRVQTLIIRGDGSSFQSEAIETTDPVVIVRDRDGTFRQVSVRLLAGPSLASHGLMAVQVQLLNEREETLDAVIFTESQRDQGQLLVPVAADQPAPRYRVVRYALTGSASTGPSQELSGAQLLVPAVIAP